MKIAVIGSGVIGLTTALQLLENGYRVDVFAENFPPDTTSNKAGAIWMPYAIKPLKQVEEWGMKSYLKYEASCRKFPRLIKRRNVINLDKHGSGENLIPDWAANFPLYKQWLAKPEELPAGYAGGFVFESFLIETPLYLEHLMEQTKEKGGVFYQKKIGDLYGFAKDGKQEYSFVVNCTGLGAKSLLNDEKMSPIAGYIVKVKNKNPIGNLLIRDVKDSDRVAYIFEREDGCILGGTSFEGDDNTDPKPEEIKGVRERCEAILPELAGAERLDCYVGLRPGRSEVRLEREAGTNIIHNYGHGGAGFTVAWGCAEEVWKLIQSYSL